MGSISIVISHGRLCSMWSQSRMRLNIVATLIKKPFEIQNSTCSDNKHIYFPHFLNGCSHFSNGFFVSCYVMSQSQHYILISASFRTIVSHSYHTVLYTDTHTDTQIDFVLFRDNSEIRTTGIRNKSGG